MPIDAKAVRTVIVCLSTLLLNGVHAEGIDTEHIFAFMIGSDVGNVSTTATRQADGTPIGQLHLELALVRNVESVAVADAHAFGQTEPGRPAQNFRPPVDERDHPHVGARARHSDEKNQATEPERGSFYHRKPQAG